MRGRPSPCHASLASESAADGGQDQHEGVHPCLHEQLCLRIDGTVVAGPGVHEGLSRRS